MSERDARVEAAEQGVIANARKRGWRGNDQEAWALKSDACAALAAADAVQNPRKLVVDWTEDGQGIVCDPSTDPMRVVGTHGLEEPQPADDRRELLRQALLDIAGGPDDRSRKIAHKALSAAATHAETPGDAP